MKHLAFRSSAASITIAALICLSTPVLAQQFESFDSYAANSQVVGQGGWEEWVGSSGAGALVSSTQALSSKNSIDIKGGTDLVHQYSGYTSGTWEYTAWQYIPKSLSGSTYFIMLSSYGATNKWSVQVVFNSTTGKVEAQAGGSAAGATLPIVFDKWVPIRVVIDLDADWVKFYYNGTEMDDPNVANHTTLGGGYSWTKGYNGTTTGGLKNIGAVDLFANNANSVYYDDLALVPSGTWHETFDTYAAKSQVVKQGGWEEWGAGAGALVSNAQSLSPDNSIDITGATDLVHQYTGYTKGKWEYTTWQYIPKSMSGKGAFILLSSYGTTNKWAVQVYFNSATGNVEADAGGGTASTKMVFDKWVQIQVVIDLDADWVQFYYDGLLLDSASVTDHPTLGGGWTWTYGPFGSTTYAGLKNIGAVDLFANSASSVYYDNMMLRPAAKGVRSFGQPTPATSGNPEMYSMGDAVAPNTTWGIGGRGPASAVGFLAITAKGYPQGSAQLSINLLVNPSPILILFGVKTDVTGGTSMTIPIKDKHKGAMAYAQHIWQESPSNRLSASNALEINIQ